MIVAATAIEPARGDKCWAFHVINDGVAAIASVTLEAVSYEWGDSGNSEAVGKSVGPIAPGGSWEIWAETSTEVRTSLHLIVDGKSVCAEFGRLYSPRSKTLVAIPVLGVPGLLAELE